MDFFVICVSLFVGTSVPREARALKYSAWFGAHFASTFDSNSDEHQSSILSCRGASGKWPGSLGPDTALQVVMIVHL